MNDCKNYVSEEDIKALKESELHIEHVARSRNLVGEKVLSVTDTIRGEKVTNRTLDGLEELYQNALSNIGYQQMGDYKPGINITGRNQIVFENGSWYIYRGDLPHVTSGASLAEDGGIWSEENPNGQWVNVGVASVAEELNAKLEAFKALLASNDGSSHIGFSDGINLKERLTQWFNASDYGLLSKNTPEKNSEALRKLSADVKLNNGGVIIIPPGEYLIGEQSRNAPADHDPDNIRAYGVKDNLRIEGISNDLTILMYGAKLKLKDGMKFGAFDPETGEPRPYSPTVNELKYRADTGFIFNIVENPLSNIVIIGGELDGNMSNLVLGGQYGDVGRQCDGYGMRIRNYKSLSIKDVTINKMPLDGLYTGDGWYANQYKSPKPTILNNVKIVGCGRDNWSITGNGFYSSNGCLMSEAAQHEVSSNPASNINVETEAGKVYQVIIDNCTLSNGRDANFIVTSQNVNGINIVNSLIYHDEKFFNKGTSAGVWMRGSIVDLHRCTLRNSRILNQRGGKGSSSLSPITPKVSECLITNINIDNSVPTEMVALLNSDKNHLFITNCTIHIKNPITGKYHLQADGVTFENSNIFLTGVVNELENYTGICGFIRNSSFINSKLISFIKDGNKRYGIDFSGTYDVSGSTILTNRINIPLPETCSFVNKSVAIGSDKELPNNVTFYKNEYITFSDGVRKTVTVSGINNDYSHRGEIDNGRMTGITSNPFKVGDLITLNGSVKGFVIDSGSNWVETTSTMTMGEAVIRFQKPTIV